MSDGQTTRPLGGPRAQVPPGGTARRRRWQLALVALLSVVLDLMVWQTLRYLERKAALARFNDAADERIDSISNDFTRDFEVLKEIGTFFASSDVVGRDDFRTFTAPLLEKSQWLVAVEWLQRVPQARRGEFEKRLFQETGATGIHCRDAADKVIPCGSRAQYFPLTYVEPLEKNRPLLGVDYSAEPQKWAAMQEATKLGISATPWLDLARFRVEEGDRQGVVVFMPTYAKQRPTAGNKLPSPELIGFVGAVVRIQDVVEDGLKHRTHVGVDLTLFDGAESKAEIPHFVRYSPYRFRPPDKSTSPWESEPGGIRYIRILTIAGQPWLIVCTPTDRFLANHQSLVPLASLLTGLVLTGLLTGFIAALMNQTWRVEQRVDRRTAELKRSNEQLEAFAYAASHDLQEPLRAVAGYCQLLARRYQGKLGEDADEFIQFAVQGAVRMQDLINDLLEYSRVSTRGNPFKPTDLNKVLAEVRENLETALSESGAVLHCDPLPTVLADSTQMTQLLQNLIGNAIKYRKAQPPEIQVCCEEQPKEWLLRVRDNGIGIDPRYAERVFAIFQRLHTREEYPGTGIGLAICKKIVERHGGRIWIESEPGQGATFLLTLSKRLEVEA